MTTTQSDLPAWLNPAYVPDGIMDRLAAAQTAAEELRTRVIEFALEHGVTFQEVREFTRSLPDDAFDAIWVALGADKLDTTISRSTELLRAINETYPEMCVVQDVLEDQRRRDAA